MKADAVEEPAQVPVRPSGGPPDPPRSPLQARKEKAERRRLYLLEGRRSKAERRALRKAKRSRYLPSRFHPAAPIQGESGTVNRKLRNQLKRLRKGGEALLRERHIARATEDTRRNRAVERAVRKETRRELGRDRSSTERTIAILERAGLVRFERTHIEVRNGFVPGWRCFDPRDPDVGGERENRQEAFAALQAATAQQAVG
jgi:hypothetical protein